MKQYKVNILLRDGHKKEFVTNTDVRKAERQKLMGDEYILTDDLYVISFRHVKDIKVEEIGK
ncbi:hypothetical protein [Lederbergia galactosidilytica]|uniref:Uncharacterized protein n=1 Tax=Lederbergia galactosidilytica TaxID=217031 RepID=A0A177ZR62_9BACI|nr:hypothetical protein [Lederbergia galactosidilytica]OAK70083.1 hypothetical protein ABB05_12950 [Lederbergia galactosidilytica]